MNLDALVKEVIAELQPEIKNRKVEWTLENLPCISGDKAESWPRLLSKEWRSRCDRPRISPQDPILHLTTRPDGAQRFGRVT
jgi:hypothetical protein